MALGGPYKAHQATNGRGLPRAIGSHKSEGLALGDCKIQAVNPMPGFEALYELVDVNHAKGLSLLQTGTLRWQYR